MYANRRLKMMGTVIDIAIYSHQAERQIDEVIEQLTVLKNRFSANDDDSELMAINHSAGISSISVQPDLYHLIAIGKEHSLEKPSNLNIALGPVVQTWRIGFSDAKVPSEDEITQALALTDPRGIILDEKEHSVFLAKKGMKIDLGALAKGYIADTIMATLAKQDVSSAMINLGGNVLVYGANPKRPSGEWFIGIQAPSHKRGVHLGVLPIISGSVVTSGIYERHLSVNGKDYHHIFDKKTGYPIESPLPSLTIVSALSLDCEIWTTRLFGLALDEVLLTIEQTPHIEGILVTKEGRVILSSGLEKRFIPYHF